MARRYHHGDLKEALLDSAVRILDTEALEAVTLRRLAREVGVSHAAPYHHFPDLDALLAAVAARGFRILREEMADRAGTAGEDPFRRLQAAGTAYVTFAVTHAGLFRLMFSGRWGGRERPPELRQEADAAFTALREMIQSAAGEEDGSPHLVQSGARAAWALVHGVATLLVDGRMDLPPDQAPEEAAERITRELTDVLGRGLRSL